MKNSMKKADEILKLFAEEMASSRTEAFEYKDEDQERIVVDVKKKRTKPALFYMKRICIICICCISLFVGLCTVSTEANLAQLFDFIFVEKEDNTEMVSDEYSPNKKRKIENMNLIMVNDLLRKREHEYKNHLNTIISIARYKKEAPLDAIVKYSEKLIDQENRLVDLNMHCNREIIASFLQNEIIKAEKRDIRVEYYIETPFPQYQLHDYELVEIIGNLMNNAIEATETLEKGKRKIYTHIASDKIKVSNYTKDNSWETAVDDIGTVGYSSKCRNSGFGVRNIKDICLNHGYDTKIYKENEMFVFEVSFV